MIEAVFVFGALNVLFEFVLLSMLSPRARLRLLGSEKRNAVHVLVLALNLAIHWGTLIGTMSGIASFICSMITVQGARMIYGYIESGRYYHVGLIKYGAEELK
jgi:hypothetical protein